MATRQLLFIHGAGDTGEDRNGTFAALTRAVDGRFKVLRPQLPEPDPQSWGRIIDGLLAEVPGDAALVGHSLGGSMLLKVIAERHPGLSAAGLILLAPPFWGAPGWDYLQFAPPPGFAAALGGIGAVTHLHGRDDEVVPFTHQALYAERMPEANYVAIDHCGHEFAGPGAAAVLGALRSV